MTTQRFQRAELDLANLETEKESLQLEIINLQEKVNIIINKIADLSVYLKYEKIYSRQLSDSATVDASAQEASKSHIIESIVKTCVEILRLEGKPMYTPKLLAKLESEGIIIDGANPTQNLTRYLAKSHLLRRGGTEEWELIEWPTTKSFVEKGLAVFRDNETSKFENKSISIKKIDTNPLSNLSFTDASLEILSRNKTPMGNYDLVKALENAGIPITSKDATNSVETSLQRRSERNGDVVRVSSGTWGLAIWYTEQEIEAFSKNLGKVPGRDAAWHVQRTKEALLLAKERGVVLGRRSALTPDKAEEAVKLLESGKSVVEVANLLGVSRRTVYNWISKNIRAADTNE